MENYIAESLEVLSKYFVYLYPGFISLFIFRFANGKNFVENKTSILKAIVISYVYMLILSYFTGLDMNPENITIGEQFILLGVSVGVPIVLHAAGKWEWTREFLYGLGIKTAIKDDILDIITALDSANEGIVVKLFMDEKGLMYEGNLRMHESDIEREQVIAISRFRRYVRQDGRFVVTHDYSGDHSRWAVLKGKDISRIEVKYKSAK